jgi:hypothetical protein
MTTIKIPRHLLQPACVNTHPSFLKHYDQRIMAYRHEPPPFNANTRVMMTFCDENWMPNDRGWMVNIPITPNAGGEQVVEDCRLFTFRREVYYHATNRNRIGIGKDPFHKTRFAWLEIPDAKPMEKNWLFFECDDGLLYGIRWIAPHQVYRVTLDFEKGHSAEKLYEDDRKWPWEWGIIHGGTCPVRYGNLFLSMFHSFTLDYPPHDAVPDAKEKTEESQRKVVFAAPYAFEATPPFRVVLVPTRPMIFPQILPLEMRSPNKDLTVFPVGLVRDGDKWLCGYGDDRDCFQFWFSTEEMMEVLTPL